MKFKKSLTSSARRFRRPAAAVALATMISAPAVQAVTGDWTSDLPTGGWGNATNWAGGIIPNGVDDIANFTFDLSGDTSITLDGDRTVGAMTIGDPSFFFGAYTLTTNGQGGALTFETSTGNASLTFATADSDAVNVLNVPIRLNDTLNIHALNVGRNALNGNISGTGGLIIDSGGTHDAATPSSVGQVLLSGLNTFSGGLTITGARVNATSVPSIGTGAVTVNDGGQLYLTAGGVIANDFTLAGLGWNEGTHGQLGALRTDAGTYTFNGAITLAGTSRLGGTDGGNASIINGAIGETGGSWNLEINRLLLDGAASTSRWVFNNTNTYTGKTIVYAGLLRIGAGGTTGSLGSTSALEFANANIEFRRGDNVMITTPFTQLAGTIDGVAVTGTNFTNSGTGVLTLDNGASAYIGTTTVNGLNGKLVFGTGGAYNFAGTGNITLSNGADLEFNTSSAVNLGTITGSVNSYLIQSGSGTTTLGGIADNVQAWAMVNNGTLVLAKDPSSSTVHAIGANNNLGLVVNGGTAQLAGSGDDQIFTQVDVQVNGGVFDLNGRNEGFDVLTGNGGVVTNLLGNTTSTLTLGEHNSGISLVSPIAYNAIYGGVIQDGGPTALVAVTKAGTGLQTLAGANTYSGATTINAGALSVTGSTSATGTVAVNNTGTLSGTGSVGNVTLVVGGAIRPGATNQDSSTGTLTMSNLTVNGGDIRMNLGATNDLVTVTGTANFTATSTLTPTFSVLPALGTTTLLNATGGLIVTDGKLPTLTLPATTRSTFALNATANTLDLVVSGATAKSLTWNGAVSWGLNTTASFVDGLNNPEKFFNLDAVTFGDGPANRVITLAANLTPTSVTVNNSTGNDYTFQTGSIAGGGTSLIKTGTGTLFLNTGNSFGGAVTITGGTLRTGHGAALGDANGQTFVSGGGTLDVNGQNLGAEVIRIAGTGVGGNGALINTGAQQTQALRHLTLTGDATVGGTARFDLRNNGSGVEGVLDLGGFTLTKTGANNFAIVGATSGTTNVTSGNILVQEGQLQIENGAVIQGSGTLTWNAGTQALFYQTIAANVTRPMVWNGITVDALAQNGAVNSSITLGGDATFVSTSNTLTLNGTISETGGARSLIKNNGGALTLNGNNTFTGGITSTGGTINLGGTNTIAGPISLTSSTLQVLGTPTTNATLGNASSISMSGSTLTLNLSSDYTLPVTTLSNVNSSTINFAGQAQGTTLTIDSMLGSTTDFNTLSVLQGTTVLASGANVNIAQLNVGMTTLATGNVGTLNILPGATVNTRNFYIGEGATGRTGTVNQTGGTVNILGTLLNNDGSFRIGHWSGTGAAYNLSGGILNALGTTTTIGVDGVNPSLNISGGSANLYRLLVDGRGATGPIGGTLNLSGGELAIGAGGLGNQGNGQINFSGGTLAAFAPGTWSAGMNFSSNAPTIDTREHDVVLSGGLYGAGGFTKAGSGRLTLSNLSSLIGGTINASAGVTHVTGLLANAAATVNVGAAGTLVLDGTGINTGAVNGTVNVNNGGVLVGAGDGFNTGRAGTIVVAAGGEVQPGIGIGTLTAGAFTMNGGTARFQLNASDTNPGSFSNDLIAVTNTLTFNGGTIVPSFSGIPASGNVYTLFTSAARTGLPTVDPNAAVSRLTYVVGAAGDAVSLTVTGNAADLTWSGQSSSTWDLNTTTNFTGAGAQKFFQQDAVTFGGAAPGTITLAGVLQPSLVTVNGSADYTFAGPGTIDTGTINKSGAGTLTLTGTNHYAGGTTIAGGTVAFAKGSLGKGPITMAGGTLKWHGTNTEDVSPRIAMTDAEARFDTDGKTVALNSPIGASLSGALTKVGEGTLILNGANTYMGETKVEAGTLSIGNGAPTGSIDSLSLVSVVSGAVMKWYNAIFPGATVSIPNTISGGGNVVLQAHNDAMSALQAGLYEFMGFNVGFTGTLQINRAMLTNVMSPTVLGSATIELQDRGSIFINSFDTFANKIVVGQDAGWHHNLGGNVVLGAIRLGGFNTFTGDIVLNNTASVILGDNSGRNSTIGAYEASDNILTGVISGPGDFAMSRYTGWNGGSQQAANIRLGGAASNTYAGRTVVDGQGNSTGQASLWLEKTGGAVAIPGNSIVQMGSGTSGQFNLRMGQSEQFGPGVVMNWVNASGQWGRFDLKGTTQTLAGLNSGTSTTQGNGVIQNQGIDGIAPDFDATLTLNGSGTYLYNGYIRDQDNSGTTRKISIVKNGTGTQTFVGNQIIYTGSTTVNEGTLRLENTTAFASNIENNATVEISAPAGANYTLGTAKNWTGNGTWIKTGPGRVRMSNPIVNATGNIVVQQGTLGNDNNLANWSGSSVNLEVSAGATFDMRADSVRLNALNGAGTLANSYGNGAGALMDTLTVGTSNGSGVFSGAVFDGGAARAGNNAVAGGDGRGGFNLTKEGTGTQTLSGTNSYAGVTTISGGTLRIGDGGTTGTIGTNTVTNNAALVFDRSNNFTVNNTIGGSGTLAKAGAGTMVLNSANTYTGATTISGGTLQLGADTTRPGGDAAIWLDATDFTTTGALSTWSNKGTLGALGNFSAPANREPNVIASEPAMNGRPVVRFDTGNGTVASGVDQLTNGLDFTNSTFTMLYAGRLTGGANFRLVSGVNNNWLFGSHGGLSDRAHFIQSNGWIDQGGVTGNTNAHVYSASVNSGVGAAFYADTILRGAPTGAFNGPAGISLGGGFTPNNNEFSDGDIGEVLVYTSVLSEDERRAVEAYLSRKWRGVGQTNVLPTTTAVSLTSAGAMLDLNGVTQTVGSISGVAGTGLVLGGGNLTTGGDNSSTSFDGAMTEAGIIHKVGSGTWTLGGNSTNTGDVFVDEGTVIVSGSLSGSTVTVASGATLGGGGTITGEVIALSGATIAPGTSPGQLDTGNFTLASGSTFSLEIGGTTAGTQYNQLNVTGSVTLGGNLSLTVVNGFVPQLGQQFWVTLNDTADPVNGVFGNVPITNAPNNSGLITAAGIDWHVFYSADSGTNSITGGNDVLVVAVPEPGSMASLVGGLGLLLGLRRRRTSEC